MNSSPFVDKINKVVRDIDFPVQIVAISFFALSGSFLFISVILRYVFLFSEEWIEDLTMFSLIFAIFLYGGPAYLKGSHIGMEFFSIRYKGKIRIIYHLILNMVLLAICGIIIYSAMQMENLLFVTQMSTKSESFKLWVLFLCVPVGISIYAFYGFTELLKDLVILFAPESKNSGSVRLGVDKEQNEGDLS